MLKQVLKSFAVVTPLGLAACASIVNGSAQNVYIATNSSQPSNCAVSNSRGTTTVVAPTNVTVNRSKTDLTIDCVDTAGVRTQSKVASDLEGWWWGNIALLSPFGVFEDAVNGAMWEYPNLIHAVPESNYSAMPAAATATAPIATPAAAPTSAATPGAYNYTPGYVPPAAMTPAPATTTTYYAPGTQYYAPAPSTAPVTTPQAAPTIVPAPQPYYGTPAR